MNFPVVAFIPVRGGSKSIPRKNIKPFCGKPLVYWNINALQKTEEISEIIVATDSPEIKETVLSFNFPNVKVYDRKPENAKDTSSTESVMLEYIASTNMPPETLFLLVQATSPLTESSDFSGALQKFNSSSADSLLSVVRNKSFFWNENGEALNYDYTKRPRRQDFKGLLQENGAFYINSVKNILRDNNRLSGTIATYEMPEYTSFEIDEPDDWHICESLMKRHVLKQAPTQIKVFLTDVDGVLTDAGMYYTEKGDEIKKFNTLDGKGLELLRKAGIKTGIITSENTELVRRRAEKLKVDYLYQGIQNKVDTALQICEKEGITLKEVSFIGDDVNDTELLRQVGIAATPENGVNQNKDIPGILTLKKSGGGGAVREFAEYILKGYN